MQKSKCFILKIRFVLEILIKNYHYENRKNTSASRSEYLER